MKNCQRNNEFKGVEVIFITNKEAKINAIMHDNTRTPVIHNDDISLVLDGEVFNFFRTDQNTFRTSKEMF